MYVSPQNTRVLSQAIAVLSTPASSLALRQNLVGVVAELLNADYVASFVWNESTASFSEGVCCLDDTKHLRTYESQYQFEDPIAPRLRPLQVPTLVSQVFPQKELVNSEFFYKFLDAESMYWGMNVFAHNGLKDLGDLRIWRSKGKNDFDSDELGMIKLLYPSIVNALSYSTTNERLPNFEFSAVTQMKKEFHLSHREAQVTELVAKGLADKVIAKQLDISHTTVRTYLSGALKKTGQLNRRSLMALCANQRPN
jgi:DNA-binding CsgD family transcriptional regulator